MVDNETILDKELAESIISIHEDNTDFIFTILSPISVNSKNYRIQLKHIKYKRTIIASTLEEFNDIIEMYSEIG